MAKWKEVQGYNGRYLVSDEGDVRTVTILRDESSQWGGTRLVQRKGRLLKGWITGGYRYVRLYHPSGGSNDYAVHRIVLEVFVGPCPNGMECCHYDGDKTNNRLSNLRWDTKKGNAADRDRHGRQHKGSASYRAKLKEEDIPIIRYLLKKHKGVLGYLSAIARRFNVHVAGIHSIENNLTWTQVEGIADYYDGSPLEFGEVWRGGNKGNGPKGNTHPFAKLDVDKVKRMREMFATGKYTISQLGRIFKVHIVTASDAIYRKTWKNA